MQPLRPVCMGGRRCHRITQDRRIPGASLMGAWSHGEAGGMSTGARPLGGVGHGDEEPSAPQSSCCSVELGVGIGVLMDLRASSPMSSRGADVVKSENSDLINFCFIFTF